MKPLEPLTLCAALIGRFFRNDENFKNYLRYGVEIAIYTIMTTHCKRSHFNKYQPNLKEIGDSFRRLIHWDFSIQQKSTCGQLHFNTVFGKRTP